MLLIGQVPLLFEFKSAWVVIVHRASAFPSRSFLRMNAGIVNAPGVEPRSKTLRNERTFESRTGRKGEHIDGEEEKDV